MKFISKFFLVAFAVVFMFSCKNDSTNEPVQDEVSALIQKISDSLTTKISIKGYETVDLNVPLVVIDVVDYKNNKSYYSAIGYADIANKRAFETSDLFRVGSITKTFVATELLMLVDKKMLSLDDTLSKYYSDITNSDKITIRQVMNMTSGIYSFTDNPMFSLDLVTYPLAEKSYEDILAYAKGKAPYFEPGKGYHYSNTNYILLGLIIEQLTGKKVNRCIEDDILKPLNLTNTYYPTSHVFPTGTNKSVNGYYFFNAANNKMDVSEMFAPGWAGSAGAMISNIADLRVWAKALASGALLSDEMKAERFTTVASDIDYARYGLGIDIMDGYYGQGGVVPGYLSQVMYSPTRDVSIVILINYSIGSTEDIVHRIEKLL
jgi:D-alanyl-D-alanine carboxypeptidase